MMTKIFNVITTHLLLIGLLLPFGFTSGDEHVMCHENERQALLKFKQSLDDHQILSSWGAQDDKKECCKWWGVSCDNKTGHVNILNLQGSIGYESKKHFLRGKVSAVLVELQHLTHLDLSNNDFQYRQIPRFIGSLHGLRFLSLANANFSDVIPYQLGNLTNLKVLDVSLNFHLRVENVEWLSHLSSLRYLDLSYVNLRGINWLQQIVKLPLLERLSLAGCGLNHTIPYSANSSSTSLSNLDLSFNFLTSLSQYSWLFNLSSSLTELDLSSNKLAGPLPVEFGHMVFLEDLDLSSNLLSGGIPSSFGNLSRLRFLDLASNRLDVPLAELLQKFSVGGKKSLSNLILFDNMLWGPIPDISSFSSLIELDVSDNRLNGSLSESFETLFNLLYLELSSNRFTGSLPDTRMLGKQFKVIGLHLDNNQFTGTLPDDLTPFSSLEELDLSNNQFHGKLPETVGQLSNLEILFVSSNSFEGTITEAHLFNLTNLKSLDLSNNLLSLNLSSKWIPTFQLDVIHLSNCKIGPTFPAWLQTQNSFSELDISSTHISDTIPEWFWDLSSKLEYLNVSYNNVTGRLPDLSSKFFGHPKIDLSSNNFIGPMPLFPSTFTSLHLSKNNFFGSISFICGVDRDAIYSLDLSDNKLSGEVPDCWMNLQITIS